MNSSTPRVSIGLPVYNGQRYLAAAIESLLAQTFTDFELIISDNASTDRTQEICREFAVRDSRIRCYREPKNKGIAWNFTRTFELARGEFFQWHAHDDLCAPTLLEREVAMFNADPTAVLCYARPAIIDECGELVPDDPATWRPAAVDGQLQSAADLVARAPGNEDPRGLNSASASHRFYGVLLKTVWCLESYGLVRTEVMRSTGKLRGYCGAEKVFLAEMALRGRFREIPEVLFYSRRHAQQYTMLDTSSAQQQSVNPGGANSRIPLPRHLRSTLGYLKLLPAAPVGLLERVRCLGVLLRYVFQIGKWKRIVKNTMQDVGIHDGYLQLPVNQLTTEIHADVTRTMPRRSAAPAKSA
jgi:glycosyltransferase involved in cell wall biosynthesis